MSINGDFIDEKRYLMNAFIKIFTMKGLFHGELRYLARITIKEYRSANGGDYDTYKLSDGRVFYLWLKAPFKGGDAARVHVIDNNNNEIGFVHMEKTNLGAISMHLEDSEGKIIKRSEPKISLMQDIRPNKKYYFDKIVRHLLM